jgi:hypothetical protein
VLWLLAPLSVVAATGSLLAVPLVPDVGTDPVTDFRCPRDFR